MTRSPVKLRRARTLLTLAILAGAAYAWPAQAADNTPVFGRSESRPWLTISPVHGSLDFGATGTFDSQTSNGLRSSSSTIELTQSISLATTAIIKHPNFLTLDMAGSFGVAEDFSSSTGGGSQLTTLETYNINAALLSASRLPTSIFATRSESLVTPSFSSPLQSISSTYGIRSNFISRSFPMSFDVYHADQQQYAFGNTTLNAYGISENHIDYHVEHDPSDHHHLSLDYHYLDATQTASNVPSESYQSQNGSLQHRWNIDPDHRYTLDSVLDYITQTGQTTYNELRARENLRLRHTDKFETYYNLDYDDRSGLGDNIRRLNALAGFQHQLYESLATTGTVNYQQQDSATGAQSTNFNSTLSTVYTKKVPYGRLTANLSLGYGQLDSTNGGLPQQIINDAYSFMDPQPITLIKPGLDPSTIIVMDSRGLRTFIPGHDYIVQTVGQRIQIQRVLGGNIAANDSVLLDYTLRPEAAHTINTSTFRIGGGYDIQQGWLDGLSIYANYFQQGQTVSSAVPTDFVADNIQDITAGARYSIWKMTFTGEQEHHASTVAPFDATRFAATYADRLGRRGAYAMNLNYTTTSYPDVGSNTDFLSASLDLSYAITAELKATATVLWRDQRDSIFGPTQGFEGAAELRWKHRQTEMFLQVRDGILQTNGNNTQSTLFVFGLRREF